MLLVLAEQPVLALGVLTRQLLQTIVQDGLVRLASARDLDHMAGVPIAGDPVLKRSDQRAGVDLAVPDRVPHRSRRRHELGLPAD